MCLLVENVYYKLCGDIHMYKAGTQRNSVHSTWYMNRESLGMWLVGLG